MASTGLVRFQQRLELCAHAKTIGIEFAVRHYRAMVPGGRTEQPSRGKWRDAGGRSSGAAEEENGAPTLADPRQAGVVARCA